MKRVVNGLVVAAFVVGLVAGSLSLVPTWAQTVPITVVSGTVTANLSATDNAVLDDIADGITVDLGANNDVTVTGTVTANLSATDNTVLDNIDADATTVIGHVDGIEGLLTTIDADTGNLAAIAASLSVLDDTGGETADEYITVRLTDGASFLSVASDGTIGSAIGTSGPLGTAVYADFDGSAIPTITNVNTEGELVPIAASIKGVQYTMLVSEDGSLQYGTSTTPLVVGDGSGALNVIVDSGALTVSATNLDVQSGGADLATEATLGGVLTSSNYAAAFGTAGSADTQVMSVQGIASMTPLSMYDTANTTGGADSLSYISAGSTEDEHAVKATAGTLFSVTATNTNAAVRYLKCENDTAANTAPGTDTPELRIAIPGATTGAGFTTTFPKGWTFSTALTCWIVTGAADSDVAEVAANELMVFYTYK